MYHVSAQGIDESMINVQMYLVFLPVSADCGTAQAMACWPSLSVLAGVNVLWRSVTQGMNFCSETLTPLWRTWALSFLSLVSRPRLFWDGHPDERWRSRWSLLWLLVTLRCQNPHPQWTLTAAAAVVAAVAGGVQLPRGTFSQSGERRRNNEMKDAYLLSVGLFGCVVLVSSVWLCCFGVQCLDELNKHKTFIQTLDTKAT